MPELMDHVTFLSQEIGPRPAGTEEEQRAALYITEQMQRGAGLPSSIEDFNSASNDELPRAACCAITLAITTAALFFPVLAIPSIIFTFLAGVAFALEALGKPLISKALARGMSQNVVAKYEPGYAAGTGGSRRRKIVLVSRYDSGKVRVELKGPLLRLLPLLQWAALGAMILLPLIQAVRYVFFLHPGDTIDIVFNVATAVVLVFVALPVAFALIHKLSSYNEAANANASGTAVLLEVARRLGRGQAGPGAADTKRTIIHGESAAYEAGLVPEGAQLTYEADKADQIRPPEPVSHTPEARLSSAKAAIAALTGKPVPTSEPVRDIAENLVQVKDAFGSEPAEPAYAAAEGAGPAGDTGPAGAGAAGAAAAEDAGAARAAQTGTPHPGGAEGAETPAPDRLPVAQPDDGGVPDWFKKARENAKRPKGTGAARGQRSRYADAFAAAEQQLSANEPGSVPATGTRQMEEQLQKVREGIMETQAPTRSWSSEEQAAPAAPGGGADSGDGGYLPDPELGSTTAMPPVDVSDLRGQRAGEGLDAGGQDPAPGEHAAAGRPLPAIDPMSIPPITLAPGAPSGAGAAPAGAELSRQRAPLAEAAEQSSQVAAKGLLNMLPSIEPDEVAAEREGRDPVLARQEAAPKPRPDLTVLPSLSGEVRLHEQQAEGAASPGSVNKAGAFVAASTTGTFAPVGEELLENVAQGEEYVDDADDSDYDTELTETGAFAGSGYVDMPKSRGGRFFDRFRLRKKGRREETSAQEWLDVDDDFDARSAGAARGSWGSFQEQDERGSLAAPDQAAAPDQGREGQDADAAAYRGADGGAGGARGGDGDGARGTRAVDAGDARREAPAGTDRARRRRHSGDTPWQGGAFSRRKLVAENEGPDQDATEGTASLAEEAAYPGQMQEVYQFHTSGIDVEVWFVALGSELSGNAGMRAFLSEHGTELRGSIIINLEALGSGELSCIEKEGSYKKAKVPSRLRRYVQKASQATGLRVSDGSIPWADSASSVALRYGFQAMSIVGLAGSKPALLGQNDDVLENVDPEMLEGSTDFITELLRSI